MSIDEIDRRGFYKDFHAYGDKLINQYMKIGDLELEVRNVPVVISGMGGSGAVGDIIRDFLYYSSPIEIIVNKSHELPSYIDDSYLLIAVSFSGNTRETLAVVEEALRRNMPVVAISTGGKLAEYSIKKKLPHVMIERAMAPRSGLPGLLAAALRVLEADLSHSYEKDVVEASRYLNYVIRAWKPIEGSKPWSLAEKVMGHIPIVYVPHNLTSLGMRAKAAFNENAKTFLYWDTYPEIYHNEVMTYQAEVMHKIKPIFVGGGDKSRFLYDLLSEKGLSPISIEYPSDVGRLAALLKMVLLFDLASIYLAVISGIDPYPVELINRIKEL